MQRCDVTVKLGGDLGNTVRKSGVSPAEIVILRMVHGGSDSVTDIQPTKMDKSPHKEERARLVYIYGQPVVDHCFPGEFANLPVSLKDVSVDIPDSQEDAEPENETAAQTLAEEAEEADEASDPPGISDALEPDDRAIVESVLTAKNKAELHNIADENEVDLTDVPDRMDDMKKAIIGGLFPNYKF